MRWLRRLRDWFRPGRGIRFGSSTDSNLYRTLADGYGGQEDAARTASLGRRIVSVEHVVDQRAGADRLTLFFEGGGGLDVTAERLRLRYRPELRPEVD